MSRPESELPTIEDARDVLQTLIDRGFGQLPAQLVVAPASTIAILAKDAGHTGPTPAVKIEITSRDGSEASLLIASVDNIHAYGAH